MSLCDAEEKTQVKQKYLKFVLKYSTGVNELRVSQVYFCQNRYTSVCSQRAFATFVLSKTQIL